MPIERKGKFLITEDLGITPSIGIESEHLAQCIKQTKKKKFLGAFGCPAFGFFEQDFNFFYELPFIVQVWFWEIQLTDIEGLYALKDLRYFGVSEKRPAVNFSRFPKLEKLVWHPIKHDSGLAELPELKQLDVWRFKPSDKSYASFHVSDSIEKLELNWCTPLSLDAMPYLPKLTELQIHYCRNLESVNAITKFAPNLKRLVVTRSANLTHYEAINDIEWEHIYINIKGKTIAESRHS